MGQVTIDGVLSEKSELTSQQLNLRCYTRRDPSKSTKSSLGAKKILGAVFLRSIPRKVQSKMNAAVARQVRRIGILPWPYERTSVHRKDASVACAWHGLWHSIPFPCRRARA
jgi:hypothetical protein